MCLVEDVSDERMVEPRHIVARDDLHMKRCNRYPHWSKKLNTTVHSVFSSVNYQRIQLCGEIPQSCSPHEAEHFCDYRLIYSVNYLLVAKWSNV